LNALVIGVAAFVAVQHVAFLVLEMFLWEHDIGRKVFRQSKENAAISAPLAKNQGLYNGFLAAGLVWGLVRGDVAAVQFFLGCVIVAGLFGGATVSPRIIAVQAVPAAIGFGLTFT
jgi:putative membrane protein